MIFNHFETAPFDSGCSIQHVFYKNTISGGRIVHKHMGVRMIPTKAPSDEGAVSQTG